MTRHVMADGRLGVAAATALALAGITGCGTPRPAAAQQPAAARSRAATPASATPASPVPRRFAAESVTFVSPREAFVLGTAPCAAPPCTVIAHTVDRGGHWQRRPAPAVPVGRPELSAGPAVWGIRFATPAHGFLFGSGLWETTDGGAHWRRDQQPAHAVLSLAVLGGQVLALTDRCSPRTGCGQRATLLRRLLAGGPWQAVSRPRIAITTGPASLIATQAGVAAVLDGTRVLVTSDGGITFSRRPTPCTVPGVAYAASVAVTSAHGLALLCTGQGFLGHTIKRVYLSTDSGAHWRQAGMPGTPGDGGTIAAATPTRLTIATASAASWLYFSSDHATSWRTVLTEPDGGMGWADLGFTTTADGVVVHGPPVSDGNRDRRPGQLLLTGNGGASWQPVRF